MSITKWGIAGLVIHTLGLGILVLFFINKNMVLFIWFSIYLYYDFLFLSSYKRYNFQFEKL